MEHIYTFMLVVMIILAVTGLFIGVMNDAANFLNSAIASKAAPLKIIMAVASVGMSHGRWRAAECSTPRTSRSDRL